MPLFSKIPILKKISQQGWRLQSLNSSELLFNNSDGWPLVRITALLWLPYFNGPQTSLEFIQMVFIPQNLTWNRLQSRIITSLNDLLKQNKFTDKSETASPHIATNIEDPIPTTLTIQPLTFNGRTGSHSRYVKLKIIWRDSHFQESFTTWQKFLLRLLKKHQLT